tara:strand:+ start:350 stop:673 length:324 start_codon:yes stop_codon:yes gene_type:complete
MENKNYKKMANNISIEDAEVQYAELIADAMKNNLWFKAKGIKLWLSPYELQQGWLLGKYLYPVKYWTLGNPNDYLRMFSRSFEKAKNSYEYAHKRYVAYVQKHEKNK